jgi:hypothetical protein
LVVALAGCCPPKLPCGLITFRRTRLPAYRPAQTRLLDFSRESRTVVPAAEQQKGHRMQYALFALPIKSGKSEAARAFLQELEGERKTDYAASQQRLRITKEVWAIQQSPMGDLFVVFFQSADIPDAIAQFVASRDAFDLWFKQHVNDTTGVDLNVPPAGALSEILSVYEADAQAVG